MRTVINHKGIILSDNGDGTFSVEDNDLNVRTFAGINALQYAMDFAKWLISKE